MKRFFLFSGLLVLFCLMLSCKSNSTTPTPPTTPIHPGSFGIVVGSFNGVDAYSNGDHNYFSNESNYYNGSETGMKWQCPEYVIRYYLQIYSTHLYAVMGSANTFYSNASRAGLLSYPNGGSVAPQVGDIICSEGGSYGHVAIVREVGSNYINVIHQNWSNSPADNSDTLSRNGNTVDPFDLYPDYPIVGWLRKPVGSNVRMYESAG